MATVRKRTDTEGHHQSVSRTVRGWHSQTRRKADSCRCGARWLKIQSLADARLEECALDPNVSSISAIKVALAANLDLVFLEGLH